MGLKAFQEQLAVKRVGRLGKGGQRASRGGRGRDGVLLPPEEKNGRLKSVQGRERWRRAWRREVRKEKGSVKHQAGRKVIRWMVQTRDGKCELSGRR